MKEPAVHKIEGSFLLTVLGVFIFFSMAIGVTLVAPRFVDGSWLDPTSEYQVQMYEVADPNFYISNTATGEYELQFVQHVKSGFTLLGFIESDRVRFVAPEGLDKYITPFEAPTTKLTSKLLLARKPVGDMKERADKIMGELKATFDEKDTDSIRPDYQVYEIYEPNEKEAFVYSTVEGALEHWVDENYFLIDEPKEAHHKHTGVLYVRNPFEYRVREIHTPRGKGFQYDPNGKSIESLAELTGPLGFTSRKDLIEQGEHIYAVDGCWYCHTDQTRTLVQDVVLNGSDTYPAPPSTANEYIYQNTTFPGTKRNGPDISRVGIKRPSRDWHKSHFWSPKTESPGSIMPSFHYFFDQDPRGTPGAKMGVPNRKFEAIYQYLMTKGTRITAPTKAWWLGKDPVRTKEIIDGVSSGS